MAQGCRHGGEGKTAPGHRKNGALTLQGNDMTEKHQVSRAARDQARSVEGGAQHQQRNGKSNLECWQRIRKRLRAELGEDVFSSWFGRVELEDVNAATVHVSVPTRFLKNWLQSHYYERLLQCSQDEFPDTSRIEFRVRRPHDGNERSGVEPREASQSREQPVVPRGEIAAVGSDQGAPLPTGAAPGTGGFEGSPLDPRFSFSSFVVGTSNRLVHAAAQEVAESADVQPLRYNPLYIQGSVGLGKTHLLHAIALEVRRRSMAARVLYLTAERFMSSFVQALRARDAIAFKEKLRGIDILLIDDMEFLQGTTIQQEFCHALNSLIDGGRQVVVAADRPPAQLEKLDARMRSRLAGGLVAEIGAMDYELRHRILARRAGEESLRDPSFQVPRAVIDFLASRLTDGGRELEGSIIRLRAAYQLTEQPITMETAEHIIRDLMRGSEPKRVKIDDILRIVSKHFGVNRSDLLSSRRNRSIVRPRQIGMYLAKQLTSRSLPEIGRRFGNRDHTTVLHAIRKIDQLMKGDSSLQEEVDLLARLLKD